MKNSKVFACGHKRPSFKEGQITLHGFIKNLAFVWSPTRAFARKRQNAKFSKHWTMQIFPQIMLSMWQMICLALVMRFYQQNTDRSSWVLFRQSCTLLKTSNTSKPAHEDPLKGGSGKSTVVKQMRILHADQGLTPADRQVLNFFLSIYIN